MKQCRNVCSTRVNRAFHTALSGLSKDTSIKVCNFDKGTGIAILALMNTIPNWTLLSMMHLSL